MISFVVQDLHNVLCVRLNLDIVARWASSFQRSPQIYTLDACLPICRYSFGLLVPEVFRAIAAVEALAIEDSVNANLQKGIQLFLHARCLCSLIFFL